MRRPFRPLPAGLLAAGLPCAALLAACGPKPPPPVAFVDSPAFHEVQKRAYGVLKGEAAALVVEKLDTGYVAVRFERDEEGAWRRACAGPALPGDELEIVREVAMEQGRLVLVVATTPNPDQVEQRVLLLDPEAGCAVRWAERLRLPVPGEQIAVGSAPAGVVVQEPGIRIIDEPRLLRLNGPEGEVSVLLSARARRVAGTQTTLKVGQATARFLEPVPARVAWRPDAATASTPAQPGGAEPTGEPLPDLPPGSAPDEVPLAALGEGVSLVIRAGDAGTLVIDAESAPLLLELSHGCAGAEPQGLELELAGQRYVTGTTPDPESFVRASGRTKRQEETGAVRDLLALAKPEARVELRLGAASSERCVLGVKAYGVPGGGGDGPRS